MKVKIINNVRKKNKKKCLEYRYFLPFLNVTFIFAGAVTYAVFNL